MGINFKEDTQFQICQIWTKDKREFGKSLTHSSETDLPNYFAELRQIWQIYIRYRLTKLYKKTANKHQF